MTDINELVRKNIIIYMNQKKISTKDMIDQSENICSNNIYKYIDGQRKISLKGCLFFSKVFNINIKDLFDEDNYNKFKDIFTHPYRGYCVNSVRDNSIYFYRKTSPNKKTLQALGNEFNISRERVRQIQKKIEVLK